MSERMSLKQLQEQAFALSVPGNGPLARDIVTAAYALGCADAGGNLAAAVSAVLDDPEACPAGTDTVLIRRLRALAARPQEARS
jgi:hypothetical protein